MAIQKITITTFLELAKMHPVLDVRSPGEFAHAHIPGAYSLPLFSDEERKVVGTTYKQQSREAAIKTGLDYFGPKLRGFIEEVESFLKKGSKTKVDIRGATLLIHCWRGGMRSVGVAWLMDLYGFRVCTLVGGYKAYRGWVREQFERAHNFKILGGYTGSGKTPVLKALKAAGQSLVDLEALASHKGSAFGAFGEAPQPKQEMFENLLATELSLLPAEGATWLEDESSRIGNLNIPPPLWVQMRNSPVSFLDVPFEARLDHISAEYGGFSKENLVNSIIRIQKRLGGLDTKNAINALLEDNVKECFRILLRYYDKCYDKALQNRENLPALLNKITCSGVDTNTNTQKILNAVSLVEKTV